MLGFNNEKQNLYDYCLIRNNNKTIYSQVSKISGYNILLFLRWHKTYWTYLIYIISLIIIVIVIKYYTRNLKKENSQLEIIIKEKTQKIREQKEEIQQQAKSLNSINDKLSIKNQEINQQNIEISAQRDNLQELTKSLFQRAEEIQQQAEDLKSVNDKLSIKNQEINQQNTEISAQRDNLQELTGSLFQRTEEIKVQNEALEQQKEEIQQQAENLNSVNEKLSIKNQEINQQNSEISAQRDNLQELTGSLFQRTEEIKVQNEELEQQKEILETKNKEINDSIEYALRIQNAALPKRKFLKDNVDDSFILFKPKDLVSGDFYWFKKIEDTIIVTAADCTGHGVPGALMSILGMAIIKEIVVGEFITHPGVILRKMRKGIISALDQDLDSTEKDGMDMSLISINKNEKIIQYAGAFNSLYIIRPIINCTENYEFMIEAFKTEDYILYEIKPDKMPISIYIKMDRFTTHEFNYKAGDMFYMFSDGYADQFGGPKQKKFKYKPFKKLLLENANKPMSKQKETLDQVISKWQGNLEQVDDIVVIGIKL